MQLAPELQFFVTFEMVGVRIWQKKTCITSNLKLQHNEKISPKCIRFLPHAAHMKKSYYIFHN